MPTACSVFCFCRTLRESCCRRCSVRARWYVAHPADQCSRPSVSESQPANDFDLVDLLDELPPLVTREESAELLRVSLSTIDRWRLSGKLGSRKIGRRVYITRRSIFALLALVAVVLTSLVAIECVDLIVPGGDYGFPPGMGHPLDSALDLVA